MDALVSTEWLAAELGAPDLKLLDATYHATDPSRDPRAEFDAGHIPHAVFMDLAGFADPDSDLPSMLPSDDHLLRRIEALGLGDGDRIVLYDDTPLHTSARAWWMLRQFGIRNVAILDGGLAKWTAEGRPLETGPSAPTLAPGSATMTRTATGVRDLAQMQAIVAAGTTQLLDARSAARFSGAEADPRPGIARGHIPGSRNLPYARLFDADGTWHRGPALRAAFEAAGVDLARPLVATCGSGITAAVLVFGAHLLGAPDPALYDGSWSEWGARPDTAKATA